MSAEDAIRIRRSIRDYNDRQVPEQLIKDIMDSAVRAPSAHNSQPWHFKVIVSPEIKSSFISALLERYSNYICRPDCGTGERENEGGADRLRRILDKAPVLIVPFLVQDRVKQKNTSEDSLKEKLMAQQGIAVACGYLMLAATSKGLGTCWFAAPLFCQDVVKQVLGVDEKWEPQAFITLGYADSLPGPKLLRRLDEICTFS